MSKGFSVLRACVKSLGDSAYELYVQPTRELLGLPVKRIRHFSRSSMSMEGLVLIFNKGETILADRDLGGVVDVEQWKQNTIEKCKNEIGEDCVVTFKTENINNGITEDNRLLVTPKFSKNRGGQSTYFAKGKEEGLPLKITLAFAKETGVLGRPYVVGQCVQFEHINDEEGIYSWNFG